MSIFSALYSLYSLECSIKASVATVWWQGMDVFCGILSLKNPHLSPLCYVQYHTTTDCVIFITLNNEDMDIGVIISMLEFPCKNFSSYYSFHYSQSHQFSTFVLFYYSVISDLFIFFHLHLLYQPYVGLCQATCVQSYQRQPMSAVVTATCEVQVLAADSDCSNCNHWSF